jgi:CRP/FNR family transcriptional regulator, cyclic AMP receptor protein
VQLFSQDTKADALGRCSFFGGLSRNELRQLAKATEDMEVEEGKTLTREGEAGSEFFVIVDGEVKVTKDGADVRSLGPGDFFGEIALLEDRPRTATVTATTPLRFFVLTRQSFRSLLAKQPELEDKVVSALQNRLRATPDEAV